MSDTMSIEALKMAQRDLGLCDVHFAHLGDKGFTLAHTDEERAADEPLDQCELHRWLAEGDGPPVPEPGLYVVVPHEVDAYSEPYPVARWDFEPLAVWQALTAPSSTELS